MSSEPIALALRPKVHRPKDIVELASVLDARPTVSTIFIPDIPGGFESIAISSAALGASKRLRIGSGVLRLLEHDERLLQRRLETIQALSGNRFILGIGTGEPGPNPSARIDLMIQRLESLRSNFGKATGQEGLEMPRTYVATLKAGIAKRVAGHATGILLNFCSPSYARNLISEYSEAYKRKTDFACYLKVFYSKDQGTAERLLINEFANYDMLGHYHRMFEKDSVSKDIIRAKESLLHGGDTAIPSSLLKISLANPSLDELREYVKKFRTAGVTLPCIYPYFDSREDFDYIKGKIKEIAEGL